MNWQPSQQHQTMQNGGMKPRAQRVRHEPIVAGPQQSDFIFVTTSFSQKIHLTLIGVLAYMAAFEYGSTMPDGVAATGSTTGFPGIGDPFPSPSTAGSPSTGSSSFGAGSAGSASAMVTSLELKLSGMHRRSYTYGGCGTESFHIGE